MASLLPPSIRELTEVTAQSLGGADHASSHLCELGVIEGAVKSDQPATDCQASCSVVDACSSIDVEESHRLEQLTSAFADGVEERFDRDGIRDDEGEIEIC